MTREVLDQKIKNLKDEVKSLEEMVRKATFDAVDALMKQDTKEAKRVYYGDIDINDKRFNIEMDCLVTIATQQPLASDLRVLASILEIITELERMGDYAKGIARIAFMIRKEPILKPLKDLPKMAEITLNMLNRAINAFIDEDAATARVIPNDDDRVDELFNKIYRELIESMTSDSEAIKQANHLQWAAHNVERMADRVTNICERTIFVETGELLELDVSDDEAQNKLR